MATKKREFTPQLTLCNGLVEAAANSLREAAQRKGLELRVEPSENDLVLQVDRLALGRIVLHLINNAIRYTDQGGVSVRVSRASREGRKTIEIRIADTGVGVRPEEQPLDRPGSALQASQQLATAIGGRIEMASRPGAGSTFTLILPER